MRTTVVVGITLSSLLGLSGCGGGSAPDATVTESEWLVQAAPASVRAGHVKLEARDVGNLQHEMLVVQASDPKDLPTKPDGSVDEDQIPAAQKAGEIEDIPAGKHKSATFTLHAGTYLLFCNVVQTDGTSHFGKGMVSTLAVT